MRIRRERCTAATHLATESSRVELIPALALAVAGDDLPPLPAIPTPEASMAWAAARRAALGLDPSRPMEGLIALDEITDEQLLAAVTDEAISRAAEYGWSPFLDGGLVLIVDGIVFSRPTCCVDLDEGVRDWIRLAAEWPAEWTGVESGHPGVLARRDGDRIFVSAQADEFPTAIPAAVQISTRQLSAALAPALASIEQFAERLADELAMRGVEDHAAKARLVAGLH
jgi:hypothetical protein